MGAAAEGLARATAQCDGERDIRAALEGAIPAVLATCDEQGLPNAAYLSQVFYVDERHVALSFQFFNKTRHNILANPYANALVMHPITSRMYRLHLRYLRTETQGPLFESMKAQLAGIASHSGMEGVFRLLGSDVYELLELEEVPGQTMPDRPPRTGLLGAVRRASERIARCASLDDALASVLASLADSMDIRHAMVLMLDAASGRLYTVASTGYPTSGVGSEVALGQGVIGVAAREATPVRIGHISSAYSYSQAIRSGMGLADAVEIPYPGLPQPHSQVAVPILCAARVLGVLFAESPQDRRFNYEDEDALVAVAGQLGATIELLRASDESDSADASPAGPPAAQGAPLVLRHFAANDSVFLDDAYLIKGVAGAILWKLLRDYSVQGRIEFSNRELRLDPSLKLPDVSDNLEARLLLLHRRLAEQSPHLRIEKTGRGRFRLVVGRPVQLVDEPPHPHPLPQRGEGAIP
ncbi:MAG TPA: GAF domain-containing protein [Ramlibacter sp.]|uniref:GAF domain-containing protein n=1 Tax=Ramlibacter sp. TaxID=1917967 RepID=UPI002C6114F5|nr:GAF domain-containing protein [Ramlibacter sp.]HVZ45577.1 GAF domain-containing protein [Ramlibacter sp.]